MKLIRMGRSQLLKLCRVFRTDGLGSLTILGAIFFRDRQLAQLLVDGFELGLEAGNGLLTLRKLGLESL